MSLYWAVTTITTVGYATQFIVAAYKQRLFVSLGVVVGSNPMGKATCPAGCRFVVS